MDVEALVEQPTPPTLARLRELRAQLATATGSSKRGKAPQILAALTQLLATATKATDLAALAAEVAELAKGAWGKGDPQLTAAREALKHFGAYAEHKLAAENLPPLLRLARRAAQDYEDAKREQAALDFDDLLLLARDLITQHSGVLPPSAALIVDEAQDNSALQNELILGLQAASGSRRSTRGVTPSRTAWRGSPGSAHCTTCRCARASAASRASSTGSTTSAAASFSTRVMARMMNCSPARRPWPPSRRTSNCCCRNGRRGPIRWSWFSRISRG
jgi:hypothetical protein